MTSHEFLDAARTKERTRFVDGTAVTVDWTKKTVTITPDVESKRGGAVLPRNR
jgi:hypothetical protein